MDPNESASTLAVPAPSLTGPRRLRRDLRAIFGDGAAFSVMVGLGETYLPAFVLALGKAEVWSGLIATVPLIAGGVLQLVSPVAVRRIRSRRRWVIGCAVVQAASFLPLLAAALVGGIGLVPLFLIAAVYWGSGMAAGASWNTWVETLVPRRVRARFFAVRNRAAQAAVLIGLIGGGLVLEAATARRLPLVGFAILFGLAAAFRLVSARYLVQHSEPSPPVGELVLAPHRAAWRLARGEEGRLLRALLAMAATVAIAGPFFTPYMLRRLDLSYTAYMSLIGAAFVAKILTLPALGGLIRRFGAYRLLLLASVAITPLPALWLVSDSYVYLFGLQLFSGMVWAGHELCAFLLLFDTTSRNARTSYLTTFNLLNAVGMFTGSLVGSALFGLSGSGDHAYRIVFALSSIARIGAVVFVVRVAGRRSPTLRMIFRTIAVRPWAGDLLGPVLATARRVNVDRRRGTRRGGRRRGDRGDGPLDEA